VNPADTAGKPPGVNGAERISELAGLYRTLLARGGPTPGEASAPLGTNGLRRSSNPLAH